ncbi:MAG TPA: hypothetical protein VMS22_06860 [Candidatus Eisenbacteria bacterium]|nr:hypothetical protein [Candidatus Eisenbacteria bacterium]
MQGPPPLEAVDAGGKLVGPVVFTEDFLNALGLGDEFQLTFVLVKTSPVGEPVLLGLNLGGDPTGIVSYESGDCTGTPLVGGGGSIPVVQTVADTVFFPMTPTTAGMINSIERTNRSYGCTSITPHGGCCRTQISGIGNPYAAGTVPFANLGIVRPLHAVSTIP